MIPPSGAQYEISSGAHRATVVEVGGGIREYTVDGRAVLESYPVDQMCDGAHGAVLVPWPNRLADGRYEFDGASHQLAVTEPDKNNATHGLLRWRSWAAVERESDRVVMATRLHPMPGYPFTVDVRVEYEVGDTGLTVRTTATNLGDRACPYGCGHHPYLSGGDGLVDDCLLELGAATRIVTEPARQLPTGTEPVASSEFDFRTARRLADLAIDFAFTDLARDAAGRAWVRLTALGGRRTELWVDETYPVVEVFTGDTLAPARARRALAVEPMTCPPNAFRTGDGVLRLEPGESVRSTWGVRLVE